MVIRHTIYSTFIVICIIIYKIANCITESNTIATTHLQCTQGYVLNAYFYQVFPNTKLLQGWQQQDNSNNNNCNNKKAI